MRVRPVVYSAVTAVAAALAVTAPNSGAAPAPIRSYSAAIEAYSFYQPQLVCDPSPKPGMVAFRNLILAEYRGSGDLGISRACNAASVSEHEEGRGWDWRVSAFSSTQRGQVDDMFRWLFATDRYGNQHANFRRLGMMYVIWNGRIWTAESRSWQPYYGPNKHTDHVHFSLNKPGAARLTSFWDDTVADTPYPPEVTTAERVSVPASIPKGVDSKGVLVPGKRYRITVGGQARLYPGGPLIDAECSGSGYATTGRLQVNWTNPALRPLVSGGPLRGCNTTSHRYTYDFTPTVPTRVARFQVATDSSLTNNSGGFTVLVQQLVTPSVPSIPVPPRTVAPPARPAAVTSPASPTVLLEGSTSGTATVRRDVGSVATVSGTATPNARVLVVGRAPGQEFAVIRNIAADSSGYFTTSYTVADDLTYYAYNVDTKSTSQLVRAVASPVVTSPHALVTPRGRAVVATGRAAANSPVIVRWRLAGDTGYPRRITVKASPSGSWSAALPADQDVQYFVQRSASDPASAMVAKYSR